MRIEIPVPVLQIPHWRVNFRPADYTLGSPPGDRDLFELVEGSSVSFRGWSYPHVSSRLDERRRTEDYVASWANFMGHIEYWRLYQSGQFLHLFSVPEVANTDWRNKYSHVEAPGIFSLKNIVFTMTEIFEFGARLAQRRMYQGALNIKVEIKQINGFVLVTDFDRMLNDRYAVRDNTIGKLWQFASADLILDRSGIAINAVIWFLEQFGWRNPDRAALERDQAQLRSGKF